MKLIYEEVVKKFPDTDKPSLGYIPYYNKHLPKQIDKLLEVGCWRGDGTRMLRHFYEGKGEFHIANYEFGWEDETKRENGQFIPTIEEFEAEGFICHLANDSDVESLSEIKDQFDVIVEDAGHSSNAQIICFKQLFINNLKSGGVYFLEDLHCCKGQAWWNGIKSFEDTFLGAALNFNKGGTLESQMISKEEAKVLEDMIDYLIIYDEPSCGTMGVIGKK